MQKLWSPWRSQYINSFHNEDKSKCVFCSIIESNDDDENFVIKRTKDFSLIMNKFPYNSGHLMVITNEHIDDLNKLSDTQKGCFLKYVQYSEEILKHVMKPDGFNIGLNLGRAAGAGVENHIHFHIVPRWVGDVNFMSIISDIKVISEDMREQQTKLKKAIEELKLIF